MYSSRFAKLVKLCYNYNVLIEWKGMMKMGEEKSFKERIANAAIEDKTDPTRYSGETLIINILEEQGVSTQITQNPRTSYELSRLVKYILEKNGIENITADNIKQVKYIMKSNLKIENGNISFTEKAYDKHMGEDRKRSVKKDGKNFIYGKR